MPEGQSILLGSGLGVKMMLFGFLALVSLLLGRFLALWLGIGPGATLLFAVALITSGLLSLWTYLEAYLQSHRLFARLAGCLMGYAGLRLGFLAVVCFSSKQAMTWFMASCTGPVLLIVILGILPKAKKLLLKTLAYPRQSLAILKEGLNYSKWVALSGIAYIAMSYVVRFVLATRASLEEVGIFSAGMTFTAAFTTLNTAVRAVLFPKVTAIEGQERTKEYLKRLGKIAPYYATVAAVGIAMLALLQGFVLGQAYRAAMPVFLVTASSAAITIFLGLGTMLVHTMMEPWIEAEVNALRFLTVSFIAYLVAPVVGALGIALAYSLTLVAGEAGIFCYILLKQKKHVAQ